MRARNSFGASTSIETFEKKLLRGSALFDVKHIEGAGLQELYDAFRRELLQEDYYKITDRQPNQEQSSQEIDLLISEKRRTERALSRLQNLFLYGESAIAEKDYLLERKRMSDELKSIDTRINLLEENRVAHDSLSDIDFFEKSSAFLLAQKLTGKREVNYETFVRDTNPKLVKDFVGSTIRNFCIKNGRIESILFLNNIEHKFVYKDEPD